MQKIQISIYNDSIIFAYKNTPTSKQNLSNTNIINDSELVFTPNYILENEKLVSLFINEICEEKNVYRATFEDNDLAIFMMDILRKNPYITAICIRDKATLSYELYEKVMENKNITYIEAESIQSYMVEMLDKKGIHSESRTEVFYISHFMQSNNLTSFSKIFFKNK